MAVPRSEPSSRAVTVMSCCRFSRLISFCGGNCVTCAREPRFASLPVALLKTVFSIVSSERRGVVAMRIRTVYGRPFAISGSVVVTPSRMEVASSATSVGVKPRRAGDAGSTWKLVAGPLMVLSTPFCTSTTPAILPMASPMRGPARSAGPDHWRRLDLYRLRCIGEVADHVLQNLNEFDVELRLRLFDLGRASAMISSMPRSRLLFSLTVIVAGVSFRNAASPI